MTGRRARSSARPNSQTGPNADGRAKVINFGIVYGLSAFGLAQTLGISREDAQAFIDAYFQRYRGVQVLAGPDA